MTSWIDTKSPGVRVAFVTGAGSGIGAATARELDSRGYRVVAADRDAASASETTSALTGALALELDVAELASVEVAVAAALSWGGAIDVLVNNAGVGSTQNVIDTPPELWENVFAVNVRGVYNCCRTVLPAMIAQRSGAIVNVASVAGLVGLPNRAAYCASKGAVVSLTRALAVDHVRDGVRVNCVCPGTVDSPWVGRLLEDSADPVAERAALVARQPLGRLGRTDEIAAAVAYLAGDEAAFVTGTALVIDGGLTAQ